MDIYSCFVQQVKKHPDRLAIIHHTDRITYASLYQKVIQTVYGLAQQGVTRGDCILLVAERDIETLAAILAILHLGVTYVPVDIQLPIKRVENIIESLKPKLILHDFSPDNNFAYDAIISISKNTLFQTKVTQLIEATEPKPDDLAYITFTSGSSGIPKGVKVKRSGLYSKLCAWQTLFELGKTHQTHLQMASIGFDVFAGDWIRALCSGDTLLICDKTNLLKPAKLYELIQTEHVDSAEFVPSTLRLLYKYLVKTKQDLSQMKRVVCGSDVWSMREYMAFKDQIKTRLINTYGLTEASIDSTYFEPSASELSNYSIHDTVPIGKPLLGTKIVILSSQGNTVIGQEPGELYIGGDGVAAGYLNAPALTQERFVTLTGQEGIWFKTGDLGYFLPDGNIQLLGRADRQVKINGNRVEIAEIEAVLNAHPDISVALIEVEEHENRARLHAFLMPVEGKKLCSKTLHQYLKELLPPYMLPHYYSEFTKLPLTSNGKVDRNQKIIGAIQLN